MNNIDDEDITDEMGINDPFMNQENDLYLSNPDPILEVNNMESSISFFFIQNSLTLILASAFIGIFIMVLLSWLAKKKMLNKKENEDIKNTSSSLFHSFDPKINYRKLNEEREKSKNKAIKDPVQDFAVGQLENVPFQCPFMEAFKQAKKVEDSKKSITNTQLTVKSEKDSETKPESKPSLPIKTDVDEILEKTKKDTPRPEEVRSFYEHIPAHVKQLEQKQFLQKFDESDLQAERKAREEQLNQIYKLMAEKSDTFGVKSFDDVKDQMRLYIR